MPEIAEVRVVAKTLKKNLIGKKITNIKLLYPRIIVKDPEDFKYTLTGAVFKDIRTCGKWLIFDLGEYSFLSHLRMEGKYFYVPSKSEVGKHTHVIFKLDDGMDLRYDDVRKFGRMELVKSSEISDNPSILKLGIEPDDSKLTPEYLLDKFSKSSHTIKSGLLDQSIINGLGNIYANEVLYACGISPFKEMDKITKEEAQAIIDNAKRIITKSYEAGGCTIRSYTSSLGVIGHYQDYLKVQSREGMPCEKCGTLIKREKIDGRSTFFCEKCQR